jgi:hypothetical protein
MRESIRFDALLLFLITIISAVAGASDSRLNARVTAPRNQAVAADGHAQSH